MFTNKVWLRDCGEEYVNELFEREIPGCSVKDDSVLTFDGIEYDIVRLEPQGAGVNNIEFYILTKSSVVQQKKVEESQSLRTTGKAQNAGK